MHIAFGNVTSKYELTEEKGPEGQGVFKLKQSSPYSGEWQGDRAEFLSNAFILWMGKKTVYQITPIRHDMTVIVPG